MKAFPILFFILCSCHFIDQKIAPHFIDEEDYFMNYLFQKTYDSQSIIFFPSLENGTLKKIPPKIWFPLLLIKKENESFCLSTKKANLQHTLILYEGKETCLKNLSKPLIKLSHINKFTLSYKNFSLILKGERNQKNLNWKFPFFNLKATQIFNLEKKIATSRENSPHPLGHLPGLYVGGPNTKANLEDGVICNSLTKDCSLSVKFNCHLCKNGWYEIVDNTCPTYFTKICGENNCGEKNKPACVRGTFPHTEKCENNSQWGFCRKGLQTFCDENGRLICL